MDKARAAGWSDMEVAERWLQLYKAPVLVERWLAEPAALGAPELKVVADIISQWRERLYDLSWLKECVHAFCPSGRHGGV